MRCATETRRQYRFFFSPSRAWFHWLFPLWWRKSVKLPGVDGLDWKKTNLKAIQATITSSEWQAPFCCFPSLPPTCECMAEHQKTQCGVIVYCRRKKIARWAAHFSLWKSERHKWEYVPRGHGCIFTLSTSLLLFLLKKKKKKYCYNLLRPSLSLGINKASLLTQNI